MDVAKDLQYAVQEFDAAGVPRSTDKLFVLDAKTPKLSANIVAAFFSQFYKGMAAPAHYATFEIEKMDKIVIQWRKPEWQLVRIDLKN